MTINANDLTLLQAYAEAGDRVGYYEHLANAEDRYGTLAGDLVEGTSSSGRIAKAFLIKTADEQGVELSDVQVEAISVALMQADFAVRKSAFESGYSGELGWETVSQYHEQVFNQFGLTIDVWTANAPLGVIGRHYKSFGFESEEAAKAHMWDSMLEGGLFVNIGIFEHMSSYGKPYGLGLDFEVYVADTQAQKWTHIVSKIITEENLSLAAGALGVGYEQECFPAGTLITLADGTTKVIGDIAVGDVVMSFGADGVLRPAPVTQLLDNVTTEWLKLSNGTVVTPGHRYLRPDGSFEEIAKIIADDGRIVAEDGEVITVTAEAIHYSADTAHMFEQHEKLVSATSGATALAPEVKTGWRTYNFTVGGTHTYIADGVRVHNDSILSTLEEGDVLVALNDDLTDAAVLRDVNGDEIKLAA